MGTDRVSRAVSDDRLNMLVIEEGEVHSVSIRSVSYRFNPPVNCLDDDRVVVDITKSRYTHLRKGVEIGSGRLEYILQGVSHGRH